MPTITDKALLEKLPKLKPWKEVNRAIILKGVDGWARVLGAQKILDMIHAQFVKALHGPADDDPAQKPPSEAELDREYEQFEEFAVSMRDTLRRELTTKYCPDPDEKRQEEEAAAAQEAENEEKAKQAVADAKRREARTKELASLDAKLLAEVAQKTAARRAEPTKFITLKFPQLFPPENTKDPRFSYLLIIRGMLEDLLLQHMDKNPAASSRILSVAMKAIEKSVSKGSYSFKSIDLHGYIKLMQTVRTDLDEAFGSLEETQNRFDLKILAAQEEAAPEQRDHKQSADELALSAAARLDDEELLYRVNQHASRFAMTKDRASYLIQRARQKKRENILGEAPEFLESLLEDEYAARERQFGKHPKLDAKDQKPAVAAQQPSSAAEQAARALRRRWESTVGLAYIVKFTEGPYPAIRQRTLARTTYELGEIGGICAVWALDWLQQVTMGRIAPNREPRFQFEELGRKHLDYMKIYKPLMKAYEDHQGKALEDIAAKKAALAKEKDAKAAAKEKDAKAAAQLKDEKGMALKLNPEVQARRLTFKKVFPRLSIGPAREVPDVFGSEKDLAQPEPSKTIIAQKFNEILTAHVPGDWAYYVSLRLTRAADTTAHDSHGIAICRSRGMLYILDQNIGIMQVRERAAAPQGGAIAAAAQAAQAAQGCTPGQFLAEAIASRYVFDDLDPATRLLVSNWEFYAVGFNNAYSD